MYKTILLSGVLYVVSYFEERQMTSVLKKIMLRKIFGHMKNEVSEQFIVLYNRELQIYAGHLVLF
jgi:hypothetical protein